MGAHELGVLRLVRGMWGAGHTKIKVRARPSKTHDLWATDLKKIPPATTQSFYGKPAELASQGDGSVSLSHCYNSVDGLSAAYSRVYLLSNIIAAPSKPDGKAFP